MHFPCAVPIIALLALIAPTVLAHPDDQASHNNARALATTDDVETISARSLALALLDEFGARAVLPVEAYDELVARGKKGGKRKGGKSKKGKGKKGKGKKGKGRKGKGRGRKSRKMHKRETEH